MRWLLVCAVFALARAYPGGFSRQHQWDPNCGTSPYPDAGREPAVTNIIGGWDARKGEWPWQVSMRNSENGAFHYCGASVMNEDWIITAAHCCEGELAANVYLAVGDHDLGESDAENPERSVHRVSDLIMHEDYGQVTLVNDICMLKLVNPITYNPSTGAVCPPLAGNPYSDVPASTSGWGNTTPNGQPATILQTVNMPTVTNEICYEHMRTVEPTWVITADMICAGTPGDETRDSCQGDSGGPLVTQNAGGLWELIGLTSWGYECAAGIPGVYCRVEHFLDWIDLQLMTTP